jgi:hypothetical protein
MSIKDTVTRLVDRNADLARRVSSLEEVMDENRRLNERLDRILDRLDPGAEPPVA